MMTNSRVSNFPLDLDSYEEPNLETLEHSILNRGQNCRCELVRR